MDGPSVTGPPSASRTTLIAISFIPTDWPPRDQDQGKYARLNTVNARTAAAMLATARVVDDDDDMRYMPWSLMLIGVSAIAVGVVGATLPPGRRLEAVLALIAGGGAGIAVLGIGLAGGVADTGTDFEALFRAAM